MTRTNLAAYAACIALGAALVPAAAMATPISTPGEVNPPAPNTTGAPPVTEGGPGLGSPTGQMADGTNPLDTSDRSFFDQAAAGGLGEVAAGQLAAQRGAGPKVRAFGRQMVADHTKANQALQQLAQSKGMNLPTAPDAAGQKSLADLKEKQGRDFDTAYAAQQVKDHRDTISLFEQAARSKDPDIAAFAQKTLPTLRHHLKMAQAMA